MYNVSSRKRADNLGHHLNIRLYTRQSDDIIVKQKLTLNSNLITNAMSRHLYVTINTNTTALNTTKVHRTVSFDLHNMALDLIVIIIRTVYTYIALIACSHFRPSSCINFNYYKVINIFQLFLVTFKTSRHRISLFRYQKPIHHPIIYYFHFKLRI